MKKFFRWQPEIATSMIYWSITLMILFISLILSLENTRPYWASNLVLAVFLLFAYLGWRRSITIDTQQFTLHYSRFWIQRTILWSAVTQVSFVENDVCITTVDRTFHLRFRAKTLTDVHRTIEQIVPEKMIEKQVD